MAHYCTAAWNSIPRGILKPPTWPRHSPEAAAPNSTSKRGVWEILGLGASFYPGSGQEGAWSRAASLKLILNKTQPPESHPSEEEGACDIPEAAQAAPAEPRAGQRQLALQLRAPRGCPVAPALALYGQNCPTKPGFAGSFLSILGPGGVVSMSPLSSHWLKH